MTLRREGRAPDLGEAREIGRGADEIVREIEGGARCVQSKCRRRRAATVAAAALGAKRREAQRTEQRRRGRVGEERRARVEGRAEQPARRRMQFGQPSAGGAAQMQGEGAEEERPARPPLTRRHAGL